MNNKQILEGLEKRYQELYDEYQIIREDLMDFEGTPEYDAYMAYTSDEIRQEMYPEQFEKFKKKANLETRGAALEKEIKIQAGNVYKNMTKKLKSLEDKIQTNNEYIERLKEKISAIEKEIEDLKASQEFQNGDQEAKLRLEELMDELKAKKITIGKIEKDTKKIAEEIESLNEYKKSLAEKYELDEETVEKHDESPEVSTPSDKDTQATSTDREQPKTKTAGVREGGYVNPFTVKPDSPTPEAATNSTLEENPVNPASPSKAKNNISQKEFKKIYKRAKKQNLTREDFEKLSVLMSDPSNYDKYGITTGVIFNKSKHLLRAMAKTTFTTGQVVKGCRTVLGIEIEKASKENDMVSTKSLLENKGLALLIENPNQKVASMELFKRVAQLDRDSLSEEKQVVYDQATKHLSDFEALKGVLKTYSGVVQSRSKKSVSTLPPAENPTVTQPTSSDRGIHAELAEKVNNDPVVTEVSEPKPRVKEDLEV